MDGDTEFFTDFPPHSFSVMYEKLCSEEEQALAREKKKPCATTTPSLLFIIFVLLCFFFVMIVMLLCIFGKSCTPNGIMFHYNATNVEH